MIRPAKASEVKRSDGLSVLDSCLPYAVAFWLAGVMLLASRLLLGWLKLFGLRRSGRSIDHSQWPERLRRLADRMGVSNPVRLFQSALVEVPMLIGWLRPTILLPAMVFTGLSPAQLEAVLAHELAHIRRHDYLVNVLQSVIETVLFYHPVVWWISSKIREERENCCDDLAIAAIENRALYASALAALEETRPDFSHFALAASQGPLLKRIRRIAGLQLPRHSSVPALAALLTLGGLAACLSGAGVFLSLVLSEPRLSAEEVSKANDSATPPEGWQIAGLRKAFGDARQPLVEQSPAVQREALKLGVEHGWASLFLPEEVAVYLGSEDVSMRLAAVRGLAQMGKEALPHAKQVAGLLADQNREVRNAAVAALGKMGAEGASFTKDIEGLCSDADLWTRMNALLALGELGRLDDAGAKTLVTGIATVFAYRDNVAGGHPEMAAISDKILEALSRRDTSTVAKKAAALLQDGDVRVRYAAAIVLGQLGAKSGAAFASSVAALLEDPDPRVRGEAIKALANMDREGRTHAKEIAALLRDSDRSVRRAALAALSDMGEEGAAFAPAVADMLKNGVDRNAAAAALCRMGKQGLEHADALMAALQSTDEFGKLEVIVALSRMGKEDGRVARKVARLLEDPSSSVREAAIEALALMGAGAAACTDEMIAMLQDGNREVRRSAAKVLGRLAQDDPGLRDKVEKSVEHSDSEVWGSAAEVLGVTVGQKDFEDVDRTLHLDVVKIGPIRIFDDRPLQGAGGQGGQLANIAGFFKLSGGNVDLIWELDKIAERGASAAKSVADVLFDQNSAVRARAFAYLDQRGNPNGDLNLQTAFLAIAHAAPDEKIPELRAHLRLWSGGNADMQRSVTWLGKPDLEPMPKEGLSAVETRETFRVFLVLWDYTEATSELRQELAGRIGQVAKAISGKPDPETAKSLNGLAAKLENQTAYKHAYEMVRTALGR